MPCADDEGIPITGDGSIWISPAVQQKPNRFNVAFAGSAHKRGPVAHNHRVHIGTRTKQFLNVGNVTVFSDFEQGPIERAGAASL
jgi:hypothetical protein